MKFAILAPGKIAQSMAVAVKGLRDGAVSKTQEIALQMGVEPKSIELYAVASRNLERASKFASEWGFEKAYGSYEEMLQDEAVELVYVASPHSHHYAHAKMCLEHGKHVLLEKAFTVNARQAEELIVLAREKGLLLAEAIWTRYMPSRLMIDELIQSGVIGKVISLTANLGYPMRHKERLEKSELAGGALLDVGVYPIHFAMMVLKNGIVKMDATATMSDQGVDWANSVTLTFRDGEIAVLHSSMLTATDRKGIIYGELGWIEVHNINNCEKICVYNNERELVIEKEVPAQINGYEYEVLACMKAIAKCDVECDAIPHEETLRVMALLDSIRAKWGMQYPCE